MLTSGSSFSIQYKTRPTFYFIGVTTKKSSIMRVFPLWMAELGYADVDIEGVDLQIHDTPENYRQAVAQIKYDPLSTGGLVTTHKIDLLASTRDMFEYLDPYAQICDEISSISKNDNRLEGHAKDPITSGLSLYAITGENYFVKTNGEVLCFGAGGSAVATLLHLISQKIPGNRPRRFVLVNRSQGRLDSARAMVDKQNTDIQVEYVLNADPARNDEILAGMPPGSIVINATGMGKDTPGSPITDRGLFPLHGIAWDFNYRGELDFLRQARTQKNERDLHLEDGWLYFLHGWTQVIAQVLHIDLTPALFSRLAELAETVR
jgi:shikimate 5-dehydrogenase